MHDCHAAADVVADVMHASLRNFRRTGLFPDHECVYVGNTSEHNIEDLLNEYFADRPLTISVDFEWNANYDQEDHT